MKECPPALKEELTKRFLFRQCIEVARCFEEGVITDPRDADVGSILAWGFAPYTGGCVSYIDLFWGTKKFVEEADRLAEQYGDRFKPQRNCCATWPRRARPSTSASAARKRRRPERRHFRHSVAPNVFCSLRRKRASASGKTICAPTK